MRLSWLRPASHRYGIALDGVIIASAQTLDMAHAYLQWATRPARDLLAFAGDWRVVELHERKAA